MKKQKLSAPRAMAIVAHPDDIEFYMAGTLLLLGECGYELHYMTLSSGNCGSMIAGPAETRRIRRRESIAAAKVLGAKCHASIGDDLEIIYSVRNVRKVASVIREVAPEILLVHSPVDYMEDHTESCRIAVTAAFARGMPNYRVTPPRKPVEQDITIYHAMPHGLKDPLRRAVEPDFFVNTTSVHAKKLAALAEHKSQKEWLDASQGMDSYLNVADGMSLEVGRMSKKFKHAEGWRRHLHLGFCAKEADPLGGILHGLVCT